MNSPLSRPYDFLKRAMGLAEDPPAARAVASMTIISTPLKRSSGTRSRRAQG